MRIDVHAHYWSDAYLDRIVALGHVGTETQRGLGAGGGVGLDDRLALMDRAGIDVQVLSGSPSRRSRRSSPSWTAGRRSSTCIRPGTPCARRSCATIA